MRETDTRKYRGISIALHESQEQSVPHDLTEERNKLANIDRRLELVEDDLKLLKAQIQATLLEIHERLLAGAYPALQQGIEERVSSPRSGKVWQVKKLGVDEIVSVPSYLTEQEASEKSQERRMMDALAPQLQLPQDSSSEPLPRVPPFYENASIWEQAEEAEEYAPPPAAPPRQTHSRPQAREITQREAAPAVPPTPKPQPASSVTDIHVWFELDKWVCQKVKELGIEATRKLIYLYEGQERELLITIVNIYTNYPTTPEALRNPAAIPAPPPPEAVNHATPAPEPRRQPPEVDARYAAYRPFGEHQELVLQFIADVLKSNAAAPHATNGNGHAKY